MLQKNIKRKLVVTNSLSSRKKIKS